MFKYVSDFARSPIVNFHEASEHLWFIELYLPHEGNMDTEASMNSRAIKTDENSISNWSPSWIFWTAIKTHLQKRNSEKSFILEEK